MIFLTDFRYTDEDEDFADTKTKSDNSVSKLDVTASNTDATAVSLESVSESTYSENSARPRKLDTAVHAIPPVRSVKPPSRKENSKSSSCLLPKSNELVPKDKDSTVDKNNPEMMSCLKTSPEMQANASAPTNDNLNIICKEPCADDSTESSSKDH